jgi:hypothetical protein
VGSNVLGPAPAAGRLTLQTSRSLTAVTTEACRLLLPFSRSNRRGASSSSSPPSDHHTGTAWTVVAISLVDPVGARFFLVVLLLQPASVDAPLAMRIPILVVCRIACGKRVEWTDLERWGDHRPGVLNGSPTSPTEPNDLWLLARSATAVTFVTPVVTS